MLIDRHTGWPAASVYVAVLPPERNQLFRFRQRMAILHNKDLHGLKTNIPIHDPCLSTLTLLTLPPPPNPSSLIPHPPSSPLLTPTPHTLTNSQHPTIPSKPQPYPHPPSPTSSTYCTIPHTHTHTHVHFPLALPFLSGKKWRVPCSWFWLGVGVGAWVVGVGVRREGGEGMGWESGREGMGRVGE